MGLAVTASPAPALDLGLAALPLAIAAQEVISVHWTTDASHVGARATVLRPLRRLRQTVSSPFQDGTAVLRSSTHPHVVLLVIFPTSSSIVPVHSPSMRKEGT